MAASSAPFPPPPESVCNFLGRRSLCNYWIDLSSFSPPLHLYLLVVAVVGRGQMEGGRKRSEEDDDDEEEEGAELNEGRSA